MKPNTQAPKETDPTSSPGTKIKNSPPSSQVTQKTSSTATQETPLAALSLAPRNTTSPRPKKIQTSKETPMDITQNLKRRNSEENQAKKICPSRIKYSQSPARTIRTIPTTPNSRTSPPETRNPSNPFNQLSSCPFPLFHSPLSLSLHLNCSRHSQRTGYNAAHLRTLKADTEPNKSHQQKIKTQYRLYRAGSHLRLPSPKDT